MELTVLGSGTAIPRAERGSPGNLVRTEGGTILVDCGPGTLGRAAAAGAGPAAIDAVLLTHYHHDHCLDLAALLFALRNRRYAGRKRPLVVAGPAGLQELLDHWFGGLGGGWLRPAGYDLEVREIGAGDHRLPGVSVSAIPVEHTPVSLAYRLSEGPGRPVLAVSGDTAVCEGAVLAGAGADLYLLECATPDGDPMKGHLTPTTAGEIAARAAPRRLVLTHFYPEVEEEPILDVVGARYSGPAELAADGAAYAI